MKMLLILGVVFLPFTAFAQSDRGTAADLLVVPDLADVTPDVQAIAPPRALTFALTNKDKRATVSGNVRQGDLILGAKLSAAVDENSEGTEFADLTGLTQGTVGEGSLTYMSWHPTTSPEGLERVCQQFRALQKGVKEADIGLSSCTDSDFVAGPNVSQTQADSFKKLFLDQVDPGMVWTYSLIVSGSRNTFKWVDKAALTDQSIKKTARLTTAAIGLLTRGSDFFSISYGKGTKQKPAKATQLCTPLTTAPTGTLTCRQAALDPPTDSDTNVVSLQARRFFSGRFAISPKISRDVKANTSQVDLPIYFLQNPKGGLVGGVNIRWMSEAKEIAATIFIGSALKLID